MSHVTMVNGKSGNLTASDVLASVPTGSNKRMGTVTLVAGTATVNNTLVTANTVVATARQASGGTLGHLSVSRSAGTSFTITSSSNSDTSTIAWVLWEPAA